MFQSTPPHGGRRGVSCYGVYRRSVSIHAPARGATVVIAIYLKLKVVSIHAPARGATCRRRRCSNSPCVSIHAPARGATAVTISQILYIEVSIHAPVRGATVYGRVILQAKQVSIHAPARGATKRCRINKMASVSFNPRPRTGGDPPSA